MGLKEILALPDCFAVQKVIDKSHFLSASNLSEAERTYLSKYLIKIEIVYDIILSEKQEFFILSADVECPDNKWTNKQIARTIASSFPYKGLVCVQYKNYMMISAFLSDENSKNNGRKVINRQVCTCEFDINELDPAVVRLFTTIEELVQTGNYTLLDFEKMCFNIVEECREEKFRDPDAITYEVYKKRMQQIIYNEEYDLYGYDDCFYLFDGSGVEYDVDEIFDKPLYESEEDNTHYNLDFYSQYEAEGFVENCCKYCFTFYNEYLSYDEEMDEDDWLLAYYYCCNEVMKEKLRIGYLKDIILRKFRVSFEEGNIESSIFTDELYGIVEELDDWFH